MAANDLFFLPTRGENFGHVIAEALSVGTPVLISDQTPWRKLAAVGLGHDLPLAVPVIGSGLRVAVVKSDSHGFSLDHEGKDTWEFSQAGADGVAIVSPEGYAIMQNTPGKENLLTVVGKISDVDLILIESRSHGVFPVLELEREGYTRELITDRADLVAVITDRELSQAAASVKKLPLDEPKKTAEFIQKLW